MKLGNKEDAKLIYRRRRTGRGPLPKGWKKLGAGAYRTSYLSPDRVVYKVCHEDEGHHWNALEFANYRALRAERVKLPRGWRVAPTKVYKFLDGCEEVFIIAMKYIEGKHDWDSPETDDEWFDKIGASEAFSACKMYDMHEGNFLITPKGQKVIIDLGE